MLGSLYGNTYVHNYRILHGAAVTDTELCHMEGQRYIAAYEARIRHAHKVKEMNDVELLPVLNQQKQPN